MKTFLCVFATTLLLCPPTDGTTPRPQQAQSASIELTAGAEGILLTDLIQKAQQILGVPFFYRPGDFENCRVHFQGTLKIPRERFLSWFEKILRDQDCLHVEFGEPSDPLHAIRRIQAAGGRSAGFLKAHSSFVSTQEALSMADRMILITTSIQLQNLPAREAMTTMQPYFADNFTEQVRSIEGTNTIIMTGFASTVSNVIQLLQSIDHPNQANATSPRGVLKRISALEVEIEKLWERLE